MFWAEKKRGLRCLCVNPINPAVGCTVLDSSYSWRKSTVNVLTDAIWIQSAGANVSLANLKAVSFSANYFLVENQDVFLLCEQSLCRVAAVSASLPNLTSKCLCIYFQPNWHKIFVWMIIFEEIAGFVLFALKFVDKLMMSVYVHHWRVHRCHQDRFIHPWKSIQICKICLPKFEEYVCWNIFFVVFVCLGILRIALTFLLFPGRSSSKEFAHFF